MAGDSGAGDRTPWDGMAGTSPDRAIRVAAVGEEYAWVQAHLPGARVVSQATGRHGDVPFDILTVQFPSGALQEIYFDISAFFGREKAPGPPCPYCGEPLRTPRARQCRFCGRDWHDPEHVVRRRRS
jgi:hypothetical protein